MTPIISRQEALAAGLVQYFTGRPCKHGHVAPRFTEHRNCTECNKVKLTQHRKSNPDKVKASNAAHYAANAEQRREAQRQWNVANAVRAAERARQRRKDRPEVAHNWRQRNKPRVVLQTTRRRAAKLQRTPPWADTEAIAAFYLACPPGLHVDHVVPLRGKLVSGLHVLNNLQYLTPEVNMKKLNKFDPDAYIHE